MTNELMNIYEACLRAISERRFQEAQICAEKILTVDAGNAEVMYLLAFAAFQLRDLGKAQRAARAALRHAVRYDAECLRLLGKIYYKQARYTEVISCFAAALERLQGEKNDFAADLARGLAAAYKILGDARQACRYYLLAHEWAKDPVEKLENYSSYLLCLHYDSGLSDDEIFVAHQRYQDFFAAASPYSQWDGKAADGKLRIGYISPDFRQHVMLNFYYAFLSAYDRKKFFVVCYSMGEEDGVTGYLKKLPNQWRDLRGKSHEEMAAVIYEDHIDILVDLAGHSAHGALPVLAMKPAPIQVSGLGYFNTTGLRSVDYFLTDAHVDPQSENDQFFTEKLLRLPKSQFCYTRRAEISLPRGAACRRSGHITFASFNQYAKVTDVMLCAWREILARVPAARLLLKAQAFACRAFLLPARLRLQRLGFDLTRVILEPAAPDYMRRYLTVDIALDTAPYPGGGTTCDALYMGVPVITLTGRRHGARFGCGILENVGLGKLCAAASEEDYISKAVALAQNRGQLDEIHDSLRDCLLQSPLADSRQYMRQIETAYQAIFSAYEQKRRARRIENLKKEAIGAVGNADYSKALECADKILDEDAENCQALHIRGTSCMQTGAYAEAIKAVETMKRVDPRYIGAYMIEAHILKKQKFICRELEVLETAISLLRGQSAYSRQEIRAYAEAWSMKGSVCTLLGRLEEAETAFLTAARIEPEREQKIAEYSNYLLLLNYRFGISDQKIFMAHCRYRSFFSAAKRYNHTAAARTGKLRLGYISPDFRKHAVAYFLYALLHDYDAAAFEVYCYANCREDAETARLKGPGVQWKNIWRMDARQAAALIYQDGIDLLVDLSGHTKNSCLPILAHKPAKVQLCGIGYFNTTGLPEVDYFITDVHCMPLAADEGLFAERLLRLPHSHFCYTPPEAMPPVALRMNAGEEIVFGCFNNFSKVSDSLLKLWSHILAAVPYSKLILKSSLFGGQDGKKAVQRRLLRCGIHLPSVELRPLSADYLRQYGEIDIALDTFPYQGGATTCEALYMGVPVITHIGRRHGARFGFSFLKNIGLEELAAETEAEYIEKAVLLARDKERRRFLRQTLRRRMEASPLMNRRQYMRELEREYLAAWRRRLAERSGEDGGL